MNKKIIALAILAGSAVTSVANAASGTINFTGSVESAACTVSPTSKSQTVNLGNVGASDFGASGTTTGSGKISVVLSSCPAALTTASVSFGGTANAANPNILALSSATGAKNVGVALYENDSSTQIPLGTKSKPQTLNSGADTTLTYFAKYMSTAATVTAGDAAAVADFTVMYN